ncbi:(2R)-sulfolactate sulfo-lyase subunit alpha [Murinocardiopsis flavida]|uniref:(2R)-sulfolactate sulfo-lyase subunit alpha n=1 Tax=Murinocardiopsis flavida TaxID=645275 RepID=A0A2P8DTU1_9ACTN|nr:SAF domain-containing protein [Murinocardiopsis flavida]PSL00638.1 (2R)-sulfolactate sulfo-lyase subunit alpha [Murinocardiopsis flavida]
MTQQPDFLAHDEGDSVAVAVRDVAAGPARIGYLRAETAVDVDVTADIPLGHKVALSAIAEGAEIREYSQLVAIATADIAEGDHVHVHNVRSARWQNSVA